MEVEKITAAGTGFEIVVVVEPLLNLGARAGSNIDKQNVRGGPADGTLHGIGRPVGGDCRILVLQRSDLLVQVFAEGSERVLFDVPRSQHVFLAVIFGVELLLRHDFDIAPVPDGDSGRLVFLFVLAFVGVFLFCVFRDLGSS